MNTAGKLVYVASLAVVFAGTVMYLRGEGPTATGNIRITSRLDEYTKNNPTSPNTIPTFLMQNGSTGIVPPPDPTAPASAEAAPIPVESVRALNEAELTKGFCTASTTRLIRLQYPGTYDDVPDEELIKSVLKQHPEYKDRICILPVWVDASPHEIVKYTAAPVSAFAIPQRTLYLASAITLAFAVVLGILISKLAA